jgi:hypothetical protein
VNSASRKTPPDSRMTRKTSERASTVAIPPKSESLEQEIRLIDHSRSAARFVE